jgi:hypothetical protein
MQKILRFQLEEKLETGNIYVSCNPEIQVRLTPKVFSCMLQPFGISQDRWDGFNDDRLRVKRHLGKILFSKEELNSWNTLEEEWPRIQEFLKSLPGPVCILAHNGFQHDFPLLANEFIRNKIDYAGFSNEVCSVDGTALSYHSKCRKGAGGFFRGRGPSSDAPSSPPCLCILYPPLLWSFYSLRINPNNARGFPFLNTLPVRSEL